VSRTVVLDTGPLSLVTHPKASGGGGQWLRSLLLGGTQVVVPEICDYELRRELLRAQKTSSVARLDQLEEDLEYLPISTQAMRRAAELWAHARQTGQPTAGNKAIDADMILVAQFESLGDSNAVIATTNAAHLSRFAPAMDWRGIS